MRFRNAGDHQRHERESMACPVSRAYMVGRYVTNIIYKYSRMNARAHTHSNTQVHAHRHKHAHAHTHTHTHAHSCTHTHTHNLGPFTHDYFSILGAILCGKTCQSLPRIVTSHGLIPHVYGSIVLRREEFSGMQYDIHHEKLEVRQKPTRDPIQEMPFLLERAQKEGE